MLTHLFTTLVQPILEYDNSIWGPHYILDNRKVEKIQRRATCLIPSCQDKSYTKKLTQLNLPSVYHRRLKFLKLQLIFQICMHNTSSPLLCGQSRMVWPLPTLTVEHFLGLNFDTAMCICCVYCICCRKISSLMYWPKQAVKCFMAYFLTKLIYICTSNNSVVYSYSNHGSEDP